MITQPYHKYLYIHENHSCRLGNQLYFVLHCFINNLKYLQYTVNNVDLLNITKYLQMTPVSIKKTSIFIKRVHMKDVGYYQLINQQFTEKDVKNFIKETILNSIYFSNINEKLITDTVAINIRATDYLIQKNENMYKINRNYYLKTAIELLSTKYNIKKAYISSDDIEYCKKEFDALLTTYFDTITYGSNIQSAEHELLYTSLFKYKIIMNSTFAYWSAYISNTLYNDKNIVYVPDFYCTVLPPPLLKTWIQIKSRT